MQTRRRRPPRRPANGPGCARWPAALAALLIASQPSAAPAFAQLTASRSAPAGQRPIMDAAQNGVPIAHIAPPSRGGVSRNQYEQFNVDSRGPDPQQQRGAGAKPAGRLDQRQPADAAGRAAGAHHPQRGHGRRRVAAARHHRGGRQPRRHRGRQSRTASAATAAASSTPAAPAWSPAGRSSMATARSPASTCGRAS